MFIDSSNMAKKYPWHIVAVFGLVRNAGGDVLMLKSPDRGWELPGGQVEEGEDLLAALDRHGAVGLRRDISIW